MTTQFWGQPVGRVAGPEGPSRVLRNPELGSKNGDSCSFRCAISTLGLAATLAIIMT